MLLNTFEYFIQDGLFLFTIEGNQNAFFHGVNLIQNITLVICFLIGPWQFVPYLFKRIPTLHFALGNVYVMLTLLLSAPTTVVLAFEQDSIWKIIYLIVMGTFWWWITRKGIFYISNNKWLLHLKFMLASYVTLLNIVLFNLMSYFQISFSVSILITVISFLILLLIEKMRLHQRILNTFMNPE